ncbi:ATP-dependent DNA ligase protein (plasmid) [Rhizobium etli bv. mimosae str. Mim1]|nr:ATP-dependent DNA ligase protein [Rhizobium etli bv. mimosae str. Mim1]
MPHARHACGGRPIATGQRRRFPWPLSSRRTKEVRDEDEVKGYQRREDDQVILEDDELENVALEGRSDFGALQRSLGGRSGKKASGEAILYAFDLLYLDGHDLAGTELSVRRHLLEDLISPTRDGAVRLSQEIAVDRDAQLEHACRAGLEGIIAKHRDRPYRSGRTGDWLKIKCIQGESTWSAMNGRLRHAVASAACSLRHDIGSVFTGFNTKDPEYLRKTLDTLKTAKPAVPLNGKNFVFAQQTLVAEIEFRGWTHDGNLRHASYKG